MDRLAAMKVFCAVVEAGGFSRAAGKLGLSTSSVTNQVLALEAHFGVKLLNRTTRSMSLTDEGRRCHERALARLADMGALESSLHDASQLPRGSWLASCRLLSSAPMSASRASARSWQRRPSSVSDMLRVVRLSSLTPKCASSASTWLVTDDVDSPSLPAARLKPPASTTAQNTFIAASLSMPFPRLLNDDYPRFEDNELPPGPFLCAVGLPILASSHRPMPPAQRNRHDPVRHHASRRPRKLRRAIGPAHR